MKDNSIENKVEIIKYLNKHYILMDACGIGNIAQMLDHFNVTQQEMINILLEWFDSFNSVQSI